MNNVILAFPPPVSRAIKLATTVVITLLISAITALPTLANTLTSKLPTITYLDEFIIPAGHIYKNTTVGGLSSIDYANGQFYMISDHGGGKDDKILGEPRYYQMDIRIADNKITDVEIVSVANLLPANASVKGIDPESLRVLDDGKHYVWSSEGSVKDNIDPAAFIGKLNKTPETLSPSFLMPPYFDVSVNSGPRQNAVLEGLSLSYDNLGIWLAMEGPLKQDSEEPTLTEGAHVRFSYFSFATKQIERQFVYYVDTLPNQVDAAPDAYRTIGVVELVEVKPNEFIVVERAYTSGLGDNGNSVKLFWVDASMATDTHSTASLRDSEYTIATKRLLLDLVSVKSQLGSQRIDNIEGITFGPKLASGNKSLLLVSDDNFNAFGAQINQILLFEVDGL